MDEQKTGRDSFPKKESTGEGSNSGNAGAGEPRTGEGGAGEGATQEGMAGQGTGQIGGADGERETSR
ncbi:MAG: hypothetical protein WCD76_08980 [Pyrinomonadaceae bacterium]